jgi:hypothetical protein
LNRSASSQENRWDGKVSDGIAQGGLNTSLDSVGVTNEALYYSRNPRDDKGYDWHSAKGAQYRTLGPVNGKLFIQKAFYVFRLRHTIEAVDLHATQERVQRFLRGLQNDKLVQAALNDLVKVDAGSRSLDLPTALQAPDAGAYSLTRPIGVAALKHPSTVGLEADGVHTEMPAAFRSMGNVVLSGRDGEELTFLEPELEVAVGQDSSGTQKWIERQIDLNQMETAVSPETIVDCHESTQADGAKA